MMKDGIIMQNSRDKTLSMNSKEIVFRKQNNDELHRRSGEVSTDDPLTSLFYSLLRDHVQPGVLENLVREIEFAKHEDMIIAKLSNGWLARYADDLAQRIRNCESKKSKYV